MSDSHESLRRDRRRQRSRHARTDGQHRFTASSDALEFLAHNGVKVSVRVDDLVTGKELLAIDDYFVMPTSSIGKVLLLIDVAAKLNNGEMQALHIVDRETDDLVSDSGLWQHLNVPALPLSDLAALVGATSDNVATNVLVRTVGLDSVRRRTEQLGLRRTALLDRVRDQRGPDDAPHLSLGSMRELAWLFRELAHGAIVNKETSKTVVGWLMANVDLSLVSSSFGLDPLAHRKKSHDLRLFNKIGSDPSVRAEAGVITCAQSGVAYAVAANFVDADVRTRLIILDAMRRLGTDILEYVS